MPHSPHLMSFLAKGSAAQKAAQYTADKVMFKWTSLFAGGVASTAALVGSSNKPANDTEKESIPPKPK